MNVGLKNSNVTSIFSGMNSAANQGGVSGMAGLIGEYNAIKSGSYAKLAKQYYSKDVNGKKANIVDDKFKDAEGTVSNKSEMLSKDSEIKANKEIISEVASLRKSISSISNDDTLFNKSTVKGADGKETVDFNYDKINEKIGSFVKNYNAVINDAGDSDSQTVLRNTLGIANTSNSYKNQLATAGISINSDNTLSFDSEKLKNSLNNANAKSGLDVVKNLFSKTSNYVKQVDTYATNVASQAASDVYSLGGYNSTGAYKQTLESIYNTVV